MECNYVLNSLSDQFIASLKLLGKYIVLDVLDEHPKQNFVAQGFYNTKFWISLSNSEVNICEHSCVK